MILLYPLLAAGALVIAWRRSKGGRTRPDWTTFGIWCAAGALLTFSFLTGFSIGLLVLPAAALALFWAAEKTANIREALGLVAGVGAMLIVASYLDGWSLVAPGAAACAAAIVGFVAAGRAASE